MRASLIAAECVSVRSWTSRQLMWLRHAPKASSMSASAEHESSLHTLARAVAARVQARRTRADDSRTSSDVPEPLRRSLLWAAKRAEASLPRAAGADAVFQTFKRQIDACLALDSLALRDGRRDLKLFSMETRVGGVSGPSRVFLVADMASFWSHYSRLQPQHRHFYEIARDDTPCHLYLDLEFRPADVAGPVDGPAGVAAVLHAVTCAMQRLFGIHVDARDVVHLESSTASKFSRHVILRCRDGSMFRDAAHAGRFVRFALSHLDAAATSVYMPCIDGSSVCLVDCGVYSRNRAMRLNLSCKMGKTAVLMPAACDAFDLNRSSSGDVRGDAAQLAYWLAYVRSAAAADADRSVLGQVQVGSAGWEHARWCTSLLTDTHLPMWLCHVIAAAHKRPRVAVDDLDSDSYAQLVAAPRPHVEVHPLTHQRMLHVPEDDASASGRDAIVPSTQVVADEAVPAAASASPRGVAPSSAMDVRHTSGSGAGPFTRLAEWVCEMAAGPIPGSAVAQCDASIDALTRPRAARIRCWSAVMCNSVYRTVTYEITGSRWCNRVGRHHRSNGVLWCVYTRDRVAVQRCWDAECRAVGYTSPPVPLPADVPQVDLFVHDTIDASLIAHDDFSLDTVSPGPTHEDVAPEFPP